MSNAQKDLFLFTNYFPYKSANKEIYLEAELPELAQHFRRVVIFPEVVTEECRALPPNVEVVILEDANYHWKSAIEGNSILFSRLLLGIPFFKLPLSYFKYRLSSLLHCFYRAKKFKTWLKLTEVKTPFVCYSYWFYNWATTLAILKKQGVIRRFVSRAHANDLYEYVGAYKWIPHRKFQIQEVSHVFTISRYGANYLKERYPAFSEKISTHYLGTKEGALNEHPVTDDRLQIISCSNLAPVKRVELIPEILQHVRSPFVWTHIGTGKGLKSLQNRIDELIPAASIQLKGYMENAAVQTYYRQYQPDIFLNVSRSEGVPVSIMEAISAGIPVMATDVGGTSEVVSPDFGYLLEQHFDPRKAAALLDQFYQLKQQGKTPELSLKARHFWELNFNATANYQRFSSALTEFAN